MMPAEPERKSTAPRKAISRRLRYEILRRDNYTCRYCGLKASETELTVDHVKPTALGGTDDPTNLVACCKDCNSGKTSSSPDAVVVAQVEGDAFRWSAAMQFAAEKMRENLRAEWEYADTLNDEWSGWTYGYDKRPVPRPDTWRNSANAWRTAGLPIDILIDSARKALGNDKIPPHSTWKYFCGIAWRRLTELQEQASESLAGDGPEEADDPLRSALEDGMEAAFRVPSLNYGNVMFRALSKVVDGPSPWNRNKTLDGE